jgi:hypothetical protein
VTISIFTPPEGAISTVVFELRDSTKFGFFRFAFYRLST